MSRRDSTGRIWCRRCADWRRCRRTCRWAFRQLLFGLDPVTFHGQFYTFENVNILPKPAQARVPIGIAVNPPNHAEPATVERVLRRVARLADAQLHLMVNIGDDAAKPHRESVEFLNHYSGEATIDEPFLRNWLASGPPEAVIEKIATYVEAGYTRIALRLTSHNQRGQLERCMAEVLPAFDTW